MFRPLSWNLNENAFVEQEKLDEIPTSGNPPRDSSANAEMMGQTRLGTLTQPNSVKPISIACTPQTPKLLRPVPLSNKVLISFEDVEDASDSSDFSIRNLKECPSSFSQASGLSSRCEEATVTFSSTPEDGSSTITNGISNSISRSFSNGSCRNRKGDVNSEEFGQVVSICAENQKLEHGQVGVQVFRHDGGPEVDTNNSRDSRDEILTGKPLQARRTSFFSPEDMENIPPASIVSIESPSISYRSHSPNPTPKTSNQEAKPFVTPPAHFRSSKDDGSSDSRASETLSSAPSSRGDGSTRSPSFTSLKSSDDHPDRTRYASISSSSSFKSDDIAAAGRESEQKRDRRRRSREQKRVLRIFDRRQNSSENRDIMDNPWFQAMAIESELEEYTGTLRPASYPPKAEQKGKRTKISKLGRSLKNQAKRKKSESEKDSDPICHDKKSIPTSVSRTSQDPSNSSKNVVDEELRHVLRKALAGKRRVDDVLECMMRVYTRPTDGVLQLLYKYFGSGKIVESAVKWITEELRVLQEDVSDKRRSKEVEAYIVLSRIYREILLHIFTTGPGTVKKAFLNNSKARSTLIRFLQKDVPQGRLELKSWTKTSISIFRIFNSCMMDHASDVVVYLTSKEGLLRSIVSKHICFPEVVSFVSKLCAADALSESSESHRRYGPPNPEGILLLAKENIVDTLAHVFVNSCDARSGNSSDLRLDMQRNSLQCLKDISLKAVTMPKFGKTNCSMNAKQIKMLNTALDTIALYSATNHVQAGIEYSLRRINGNGTEREELSSLFERNYPLVHMLSLSTDLLDSVYRASESNNFAVRRTIGTVSTKNLEDVLLSRLDDLRDLLGRHSIKTVSSTQLSIIQLLRCLFASGKNNVWVYLSNKNVPELLLSVVEDNELRTLVHKAILECLVASLKRKEAVELHRQWVTCIGNHHGWTSEMRRITEEKKSRGHEDDHKRSSQIQCTYVQITSVLMDVANSVHKTNLDSFFTNHGVKVPFMRKLEVEITRKREVESKPCGGSKPEGATISVLACTEFLAARLNDVNAV